MATKKKITKKTDSVEAAGYTLGGNKFNKYGVCLDCNGGNPDCTHQNLVEDNGKVFCATCGITVS